MSRFFKLTGLRPSDGPYITGDAFRALAEHRHDETSSIIPESVQKGDVVFVDMARLRDYLSTVHPKIKHPYILIEHNGDGSIDESIGKLLDEKIIRFYAQCVTAAHPKVVPIPIGIANKHHGFEGFRWFMKTTWPKPEERKARIFYHFSVQTNPKERGPALEYFNQHPLCDTIHTFIPYASYKNLLASYCFTASPAGNTLGSHRTWEALYLRTIPIVKRTADAEACVALGMPLWIVDDWAELDGITEAELRSRYETMMLQANFEAVYMDYWRNRIRNEQKAIRTK
jgi:hypothetical protein